MEYLLKVTLAWALFLLLFEALYKNNRRFAANRLYLLMSVAIGLLLPLVPLPESAPAVLKATQSFYQPSTAVAHNATAAVVNAAPVVETHSLDIWFIMRIVYGIGAILLLLKCLFEIGRITYLILNKPRLIIQGHKVIITGNEHAPYSFMGWIFIADDRAYASGELDYILRHEAAHNHKKHWLDLLALQLVCIVCWFHPLIWRYRYLLQLQHEYEADKLAANNNSYAYGNFLLQQTLLNGVPSIAHSFHFSPIKNRIDMLTKRRNQTNSAWKYLLVIPALFACTFLMAKAAGNSDWLRQGSVTTFKGNTLKWRETDTVFYNRDKKVATVQYEKGAKRKIVIELNGEPVYQNEYLKTQATYKGSEMAYIDEMKTKFKAVFKNTKDSGTAVNITNIVINKEGKIVAYNLTFFRPFSEVMYSQRQWDPFIDQSLNKIMDKIIVESPDWKPALINGRPVNCVVDIWQGGC